MTDALLDVRWRIFIADPFHRLLVASRPTAHRNGTVATHDVVRDHQICAVWWSYVRPTIIDSTARSTGLRLGLGLKFRLILTLIVTLTRLRNAIIMQNWWSRATTTRNSNVAYISNVQWPSSNFSGRPTADICNACILGRKWTLRESHIVTWPGSWTDVSIAGRNGDDATQFVSRAAAAAAAAAGLHDAAPIYFRFDYSLDHWRQCGH